MLPMQQELVLDEFSAGSVDDFRAETFVLQQLQQVKTLRRKEEIGKERKRLGRKGKKKNGRKKGDRKKK